MNEFDELSTTESQPRGGAREYKSDLALFGLPLVHVKMGGGQEGPQYRRGVAKGWIAIGDLACGVLFACGGVAVGGIAIGGVSLGGISIAGVALGVLAVGGLAIGGWAVGGLAIGMIAFGGLAIAWHAALGGLAIAKEFAVGGGAFAANANNALANGYIQNSKFFSTAGELAKYTVYLPLLALLPLWFNWRACRHRAAEADRSSPPG